MEKQVEKRIADANIFFDFAHGKIINILEKCSFSIVTTDFVVNEMLTPSVSELRTIGTKIISLNGRQVQRMIQLRNIHRKPSDADISALTAAEQLNIPLLSGDGDLRNAAKELGVVCNGTLWMLDLLVKEKRLNKEDACIALGLMIENNRRLPVDEVKKRINLWR